MPTGETNENGGTSLKSRLIELAAACRELSSSDGEEAELARRLDPLLDPRALNVFRIVVMGEIKKGKSSFINALLGRSELLPISTNVATSTVFKLVYGPIDKFTVFFQADVENGSAPPPLEIEQARLAEFGTEDGNPDNAKRVDFIAVELPHALLAEGIAIIDTPGVGGLFKRHREMTFRYAPQADVVFFVVDSVEAVISEDEINFLRELRKNTQQIVFLQTKIDIAGAEQVRAWKQRNLEVLAKVLETDATQIPYFLVGAKQKSRADRLHCADSLRESGYLEVIQYLRRVLIPSRDRIIAQRRLPLVESELLSGAKLVSDRLVIARDATSPQLTQYQSQLAEVEQEFDNWQNDVWPLRLRAFQDQTGKLRRDVRSRLQDALSSDHPDCADSIKELRSQNPNVESVNESSDQFLVTWAARWNGEADAILTDYREGYFRHCTTLLGEIAEDLRNVKLPELGVEPISVQIEAGDMRMAIREATMDANIFGALAQRGARVLGAGAGIAKLGGLIATPTGWLIGSAASVGYLAVQIWSAVQGYQAARRRQRDFAVASVERAMVKIANLALRGALRILDELSADLDSASSAQIRAFLGKAKHQFSSRRQEIVEVRNRSAAELKTVQEALRGRLERYQELLKQFLEVKRQLA